LHTGVVGGRTRRRIETLVGVPVVTAVGPRQFGGERAKDVVQRLGDDDVVIDGHQSVQHDVPDADTYIRQPTRRAIRSSHADTHKHTHTHTHTRILHAALWTLPGTTRVSLYQKVHFTTFWIFWCKMKITQADTPTIRMDCHLSRLIGAPSLPSPRTRLIEYSHHSSVS